MNFYDGGLLLGSAPLVNGTAMYSVTLSPGAAHVLTAVYLGDTNFTGSNSVGSVTATVAPLDFTFIATGSTGQNVVPGSSIAYTFQIAPLYGTYVGPVSFTVTGLPPGATATFSPSTIAANGGTQTVTLTILTASALAHLEQHKWLSGSLALLFLPLFCLRRRRRTMTRLLAILLFVFGSVATLGLTGCGSNSNGFFGQAQKSYSATVTATSGTLVHTSTVTLNVE